MTAELFAGVNVKPIVLQGKDIDSELVRYARVADADALFLNAAGHEISARKQDIIRQVDAPVMLVPPAAS
jgi:nucleotide-binding universal stress UspA family protein